MKTASPHAVDIEGQLALWQPTSETEKGRETMNAALPATLIVGLDTSQAPVRMVATAVDEERGFIPNPISERTFQRLGDFIAFWNQDLKLKAVRIAVPMDGPDPLGIRTWLELAALQPLEAYPWLSYRAHFSNEPELRHIAMPEAYKRAYALAVYASYRPRSAAIARGLWAKVFEAQDLLKEIAHEVHRLAAALPKPEDWQPGDVPF